jgi:hypothetical protein
MYGEKIKMAAKNQDGVRWTIFPTEIQLKCHLAALRDIFFGCKSVGIKVLFLKNVIWAFEI